MTPGDLPNDMELVRLWIADAAPADLRTLRAIINGKLSRRTISPEQQRKMQAAKLARAPRPYSADMGHSLTGPALTAALPSITYVGDIVSRTCKKLGENSGYRPGSHSR